MIFSEGLCFEIGRIIESNEVFLIPLSICVCLVFSISEQALEDDTGVIRLRTTLGHLYMHSYSHVELLPRDTETTVPITDLPTQIDDLTEQRTLPSYEEIFYQTAKKFLILGKEWIGNNTKCSH